MSDNLNADLRTKYVNKLVDENARLRAALEKYALTSFGELARKTLAEVEAEAEREE